MRAISAAVGVIDWVTVVTVGVLVDGRTTGADETAFGVGVSDGVDVATGRGAGVALELVALAIM